MNEIALILSAFENRRLKDLIVLYWLLFQWAQFTVPEIICVYLCIYFVFVVFYTAYLWWD